MKKRILLKILIIILLFSSYTMPISAHDFSLMNRLDDTTRFSIEPYADVFEWVYKRIHGNLYKRLFNRSTNKWVGDWILC